MILQAYRRLDGKRTRRAVMRAREKRASRVVQRMARCGYAFDAERTEKS